MKLIWKLLRQPLSFTQLMGFALANLCGLCLVMLGIQFYQDVRPAFTQGDSFLKKDYVIVSKKVSTLGTLVGKSSTFSNGQIKELEEQPFIEGVGQFTPSRYRVSASIGVKQIGLQFSTAFFFESVPDEYVDVELDSWTYREGDPVIPIILPRSYLNLYNFGFAQSRGLPQLSDGLIQMINLDIRLSGGGVSDTYAGKIVGFSNRLNTILVPQSFMDWANGKYADKKEAGPARLILEAQASDEKLVTFLQERGYETEVDPLQAGRMMGFLRVLVGLVMGVGLFISLLSFYLLMLSIYLLLQKNSQKLENLLLIGYRPSQVALPYQLLSVCLNFVVYVVAVGCLIGIRSVYLPMLQQWLGEGAEVTILSALAGGFLLIAVVSIWNCMAIRKKVASMGKLKQ